MAGTSVLVTGGCGRIGSELVNKLVAAGDSVTVIDMKHGDVKGVKYITAPMNEIVNLGEVDIVYHLAASIDYKATKEELKKRNVYPTACLLDLCKNCKQFIFMSTTSVYNESDKPITEEMPADPYTNYGWSKLECEKLIRASGVPYTIMRSSQVYGPAFEEGYVTVLKNIQNGHMRVFGKGDNYIPLVHISDLVGALLLVKGNKKALNQVFNVDGDYGKTQNEFMELAAKVLGAEPPASHISPTLAKLIGRLMGKSALVVEYADKLTKDRRISISKLSGLGFKPKTNLEQGIREVVKAFRERGLLK